MSLRLKLVIIILFVALVPLAVSSVTALRSHQRAFDEQLDDRQRNIANVGANVVRDYFSNTTRQLRVAANNVSWTSLSATELRGALWLVFAQSADVSIVALLDHRGQGVAPSVYLRKPPADSLRADRHPIATDVSIAALPKQIPFAAALATGTAVGDVFRVGKTSHVAIALRVQAAAGKSWVVVASLALDRLCQRLGRMRSKTLTVSLTDQQGRALCAIVTTADPALAALTPGTKSRPKIHTYETAAGTTMLAAVASARGTWRIIAEQPRAMVLAPGRRMRNQALYWLALGVIVAVGTGVLLARGISKPIDQLVRGANLLADGKFDARIEVTSRDELGELSRTFNHMSDEIERRDAEIRGWNAELHERVDTRTRELADAQELLLQSQKVAAVATLGAGIAHEINNPLTTVMGGTQLLRSRLQRAGGDAKTTKLLDAMEADAQRIKDIVQTMLEFSRDQDDEKLTLIELNAFLDRTLELSAAKLSDANISITRDYATTLPSVRGSEARLSQAVLHVISNAINAMTGSDGTIFVTTSQPQDKLIEVTFRDTGIGMTDDVLDKIFDPFFTTKAEWSNQGLGLTEAHRIITEHHGTIRAESEVDVGTRIVIHLPRASIGAHLV